MIGRVGVSGKYPDESKVNLEENFCANHFDLSGANECNMFTLITGTIEKKSTSSLLYEKILSLTLI